MVAKSVRTTLQPWLKPLFVGIYVGESDHSRVSERWCLRGFRPQYVPNLEAPKVAVVDAIAPKSRRLARVKPLWHGEETLLPRVQVGFIGRRWLRNRPIIDTACQVTCTN